MYISYWDAFRKLFNSKNLRIIIILSPLGGFVSGSLNWFGPYLLSILGGSLVVGASYASVLILGSFIRIIGGALADTIGRKKTIILSFLIRLLVITPMIFFGMNILMASLFIITFELTRFLRGPASSTIIYESVEKEFAGKIFAILRVIPLAFSVLGAVLIGYLAESRIFLHLYALITLIALFLSLNFEETILPEQIYQRSRSTIEITKKSMTKIGEGMKFLIGNYELRTLMILAGIIELTGFMSWIYIPLILSHRGMSPEELGYIYGLTVVARSVGTMIGGHLVDKYGAYKTIVIDCLSSAPSWLLIALVTDPFINAYAFIINELIVFSPIAMIIAVLESADKKIRGTVRGGFQSIMELMGSLGVALGSILYTHYPSLPYILTGVAWIFVGIFVYIYFRETVR